MVLSKDMLYLYDSELKSRHFVMAVAGLKNVLQLSDQRLMLVNEKDEIFILN
jgi:hypothetical protein